jgi:hypothetical protein
METYLKELIVALSIGLIVFRLAKPISLRFTTEIDFNRRRNLWIALTVTAFLSPSFWIFVVIAAPLLIYATRRDSNPIALYLLLFHVVPQSYVSIPIPGAHGLLDIDNYRLLSIFVLFPAAMRGRKVSVQEGVARFDLMDTVLFGWGLLQIAIFLPPDLPNHVILHDSITNLLRRAVIFLIDVYVLYYSVSRCCHSRTLISEAMAAFCLSCAILSLVGLFEFARHWLLYVDIAARWSDNSAGGFYLLRGNELRAQASSGHPLALGYLAAISSGFWLYLKSFIQHRSARIAVTLVFWAGLLAAFSRGPWLGAIIIYFAFSLTGPRSFRRAFWAIFASSAICAVILISPLGERIATVIPFLGGSVDSGSTAYRERLAERTWELVQQSPFFGDQLAYSKMDDLRQGQGIIDLVDTYAQVALFYGLIGLALFMLFILLAARRALAASRSSKQGDVSISLLGGNIFACILGTLVMLASCSFILGYEKMFYVLAGLATAYWRVGPIVKKESSVRERLKNWL